MNFAYLAPLHVGFIDGHALNRSSNMIGNWLRAANRSWTLVLSNVVISPGKMVAAQAILTPAQRQLKFHYKSEA